MAKRNKDPRLEDQEDDGRTVADMSDLAPHRTWMGGWSAPQSSTRRDFAPPEQRTERPAWEQPASLDRTQRFWAVMGALKASLLIGMVYVIGFALAGWLMLMIWS